ncbi:MAG: adenosylmethionine--8-amino-7-oxononanoate transaminase [Planctomycetes bacterium]|nr:adenosylmethionine--8-amino-7-oxononanoate transaminase [Planctomycetota bacterium]
MRPASPSAKPRRTKGGRPAATSPPAARRAAAAVARLDRRFVWHPFTPMREWEAEPPLIIERARGVRLYDLQGRAYLDGVSSLWCNVHGHRQPAIDRAVAAQLRQVAHTTMLGLGNVPAARLAARLVRLAPRGLTRVFYSDSGSTAVEAALKIAFQFWLQQRPPRPERGEFLAFENAYHGDTIGAVSVGGMPLFHAKYGRLCFAAARAPMPRARPGVAVEDQPETRACQRLIERRRGRLAAVIVEPIVQGAAGIVRAAPGFLRLLAGWTRAAGALLIADEVATGFGRTGRMFACEHEGVSPDLLCLAKGLTGGYLPLAATLATERVYEGFLGAHADLRTFFHGHTYTGNPLACAAALASLDCFRRERTLTRLRPKIALLWRELRARLGGHPHVRDIRGEGFMVGLELCDAAGREIPFQDRAGHRVIREARARGVILRPLGNVVVLMPPLAMEARDIERLVAVTADSITAAFAEH